MLPAATDRSRPRAELDSGARPAGSHHDPEAPCDPSRSVLSSRWGSPFVDGSTARWTEIRDLAVRAEDIGFDTVWVPDELLWRPADGETQGWWECIAMTGAVAAATSRIKVGTWVLSALHRNPGITAKAVETIDEISGGRFVFGLGSGHAGRQAHAFGLPEDHVFGRFEEAVQIIVPLLRQGHADFEGTFHAARDLEHRPLGPRPGRIPIMMGAKGPKMLQLAVRHADIWSWYVEERSDLTEFGPRLDTMLAACEAAGRDPATMAGRRGSSSSPRAVTGAAEVFGVPRQRQRRGDRRRHPGLRRGRLHAGRAAPVAAHARGARGDGAGRRASWTATESRSHVRNACRAATQRGTILMARPPV